MRKPEVLSERQVLELMIIETNNELTKARIIDRIQQRNLLKSLQVKNMETAMAANQQAMRRLQDTLRELTLCWASSEENAPTLAKVMEDATV